MARKSFGEQETEVEKVPVNKESLQQALQLFKYLLPPVLVIRP